MKLFYSPEYLLPGSAVETVEKAGWIAASLIAAPIADIALLTPAPLEPALLHRAHGEVYVEAVRTGVPRALATSSMLPWSERLYTAVMASTAGVVAAMRAARDEGTAGSLSSGLHHARRTSGAGLCTFNGLALAALLALDEGARSVLILDLDAHCGGGTWSIIAHEPRVFHADVSVNDYDRYAPDDHGVLTLVADDSRYLDHVRDTLRALDAMAFDLCLYNAGVDVCTGHPHDLITADVVAARERMVFDWCRARGLPVAFVLAGGYVGASIDREALVALHRATIEAATTTRSRAPEESPRGPAPSHETAATARRPRAT